MLNYFAKVTKEGIIVKKRTEPFLSSIFQLLPVVLLMQNHGTGCKNAGMSSQKTFKKIKIFRNRKEISALTSLYICAQV